MSTTVGIGARFRSTRTRTSWEVVRLFVHCGVPHAVLAQVGASGELKTFSVASLVHGFHAAPSDS